MIIARQQHWESRLGEFVEAHRHETFEWGRTDCCAIALKAIDAMCLTSVWSEFDGKWSNKKEAIKFSKKEDLTAWKWLMWHGAQQIPRAFAQNGDILVEGRGKLAGVVIFCGYHALSVDEQTGIEIVSKARVREKLLVARLPLWAAL